MRTKSTRYLGRVCPLGVRDITGWVVLGLAGAVPALEDAEHQPWPLPTRSSSTRHPTGKTRKSLHTATCPLEPQGPKGPCSERPLGTASLAHPPGWMPESRGIKTTEVHELSSCLHTVRARLERLLHESLKVTSVWWEGGRSEISQFHYTESSLEAQKHIDGSISVAVDIYRIFLTGKEITLSDFLLFDPEKDRKPSSLDVRWGTGLVTDFSCVCRYGFLLLFPWCGYSDILCRV